MKIANISKNITYAKQMNKNLMNENFWALILHRTHFSQRWIVSRLQMNNRKNGFFDEWKRGTSLAPKNKFPHSKSLFPCALSPPFSRFIDWAQSISIEINSTFRILINVEENFQIRDATIPVAAGMLKFTAHKKCFYCTWFVHV